MDTISPERRSANMARIRGRDTRPELTVRRFLFGCGFRYRLHVRGLPGRPDIVLPRHRAVVLVHGCFWHSHRCKLGRVTPKTNADFWAAKRHRTRDRDAENRAALRRLGWRVYVAWECAIETGRFADRLLEWLGGLPPPARTVAP